MVRTSLAVIVGLILQVPAAWSQDQRPAPALPAATNNRKPIKVYVLAGQSNMQGHASVATFPSMADDPKTAPLLKKMLTADGKPKVCERVWISSIGCQGDAYTDLTEKTGRLTVGYGAPMNKIGPEFTFGLTMEERGDGPVLIIKTAWGGRSLHTDFRPPSAGPYQWTSQQLEQYRLRGKDIEEIKAEKAKATGVYYRHMIEHVRKVLNDIKRVVPDSDEKQGYELAGFVWFQGFNDYVDGGVYPQRHQADGYQLYTDLLCHLIRDVRKDLSAPKMPFVIGVMGIDGVEADKNHSPMANFRNAQRKVATLDEFKGNVFVVETAPFWDEQLDALKQKMDRLNDKLNQQFQKDPTLTREAKEAARARAIAEAFTADEYKRLKEGVSNGGYHYLGAAKIMAPIGKAFADALLDHKPSDAPQAPVPPPQPAEMGGYLLVPHSRVGKEYNGGFSMYVAAWPLLKNYPGQNFQSGLFGTWMFAQYDGKKPEKAYSDIEGGLGWWRDTRFATETPKFIMGGVALNFVEWANGPGAGKGRDWKNPMGHYAVAQLSPWVLWPPDGLNVKQGTKGELFGYGYLPLPLIPAKKTTGGKNVPTGDHCWTLFLNTGNFKGPVTFFVPYFWSKPTIEKPELAGMFLDARPSEPNKAVQMETQHIPAYIGTDATGNTYARVAPILFPAKADGVAPLIHRITAYKKEALWDGVKAWFEGGPEVSGTIHASAAAVHTFESKGGATWQIYLPNTPRDKKHPIDWSSFATPIAIDGTTYGYKWADDRVTKDGDMIILPEYYKLTKGANGKEQWVVVSASEVPPETGLAKVTFPRKRTTRPQPYVTPDEPESTWKKPGPVAGPFEVKLGDGSTVTYAWYRFADQPALLNADLTDSEREALQKRVELLHAKWTKDKEYLPPPTIGKLADLDPAVLVTPPKGLEVGYVPIVLRQARKAENSGGRPDVAAGGRRNSADFEE